MQISFTYLLRHHFRFYVDKSTRCPWKKWFKFFKIIVKSQSQTSWFWCCTMLEITAIAMSMLFIVTTLAAIIFLSSPIRFCLPAHLTKCCTALQHYLVTLTVVPCCYHVDSWQLLKLWYYYVVCVCVYTKNSLQLVGKKTEIIFYR